jgi:hypothetical protein
MLIPRRLRRFATGPALAAFLVTIACNRPAAETGAAPAQPPPPQLFFEPAPAGRDAEDVGRFLAGLPGASGSPFFGLEELEDWKAHRLALDRAWSRIQAQEIAAMKQFQSQELSGAAISKAIVFYPFSGPDALILTVFFPRSPAYVMVGLEPPGTLPAPEKLAQKDLERYLEAVRSTVHSELHRSFFITREMDRQFRGQVSDGLLPTILHLLVRTGHTVIGHRHVRLDPNGRVVERPVQERGGRNHGVQIDFRAEADQSVHQLFYFSVNLSDARLRQNEPFLRFLSRLEGPAAFLKATSYLIHRQEFSIIRQQLLDKSVAILQDDSGIPYRFFEPSLWRVQLYGAYDRPYGSFRWLQQPDLNKAYATQSPKPLGFHIGYGFARIPSNLLLAVRTPR